MNPEPQDQSNVQGLMELRVKVAKLLGWTKGDHYEEGFGGSNTLTRLVTGWHNAKGTFYRKLPDFPSDLNACREFEEALTDNQRYDYVAYVIGKAWGDVWTSDDAFALCHATAEQRCRAFVALHMEGSSVEPKETKSDSASE